jgi:hypothetical protein
MAQPAFKTLDDVVSGLAALEARFLARGDRRAIFLTVYGLMSREMRRRIEAGTFRDHAWVSRYVVAFANYYRDALDGFERGVAVPKSWRIAFSAAHDASGLVLQDVLLGINAHINHDLALALTDVSIGPDRAARQEDHAAVNGVLRSLTDAVADRVAELYAEGLAGLDACAGLLDEEITNFSFEVARENAWESAVALSNARFEIERAAIRRLLDIRSAAMARLILLPNRRPELLTACQRVEAGGWWRAVQSLRSARRDGPVAEQA